MKETDERSKDHRCRNPILALGVLLGLYVFLLGLALLGDAFQVLAGRAAGRLFEPQSAASGLYVRPRTRPSTTTATDTRTA